VVIGGDDSLRANVEFNNKGRIKHILVPSTLETRLTEIVSLAGSQGPTKVTNTTLFGWRHLDGCYRAGDWIQLRPPQTSVVDHTLHSSVLAFGIDDGRPHPFVLEVGYVSAPGLPFFDGHRRMTAVNEARLLTSAFLELPVFQSMSAFAYVLTPQLETALASCTAPQLENPSEHGFSDVSHLPSLEATDEELYFKRLGVGVSTFEVPDMVALRARWQELMSDDRMRFLRASANLWDSSNPANAAGNRLVSAISAIEALLPEGEKCGHCKSHTGIATRFKDFVRRFVPSSEEVLKIYDALYPARSSVAHGRWHQSVDQPMFALSTRDLRTEVLAAWAAVKNGRCQLAQSRRQFHRVVVKPSLPFRKATSAPRNRLRIGLAGDSRSVAHARPHN
jgi:hypothetical protein